MDDAKTYETREWKYSALTGTVHMENGGNYMMKTFVIVVYVALKVLST
jgi:hypothetical protein